MDLIIMWTLLSNELCVILYSKMHELVYLLQTDRVIMICFTPSTVTYFVFKCCDLIILFSEHRSFHYSLQASCNYLVVYFHIQREDQRQIL